MVVGGPCSVEGCTRAHMYNSPVCHKHMDNTKYVLRGEIERGYGRERGGDIKQGPIKEQIGLVIILFGMVVALVGAVWAFDDYVGSQMAGSFLLFTGLFSASIGMKLVGSDKIDSWLKSPISTSISMRHRPILILCLIIFSYGYYVYSGAI